MNNSLIKLLAFMTLGFSGLRAENLRSYRDQNNDAYVEWTALEGYNYTLQSSDDLQSWTDDSTWLGFGQTVSVLVHEGTIGGGGGRRGALFLVLLNIRLQ
jgi:hypothetical protein